MTHLAMALRFLASDAAVADAVFVVPEGSADPLKPRKSEYRFRFEILKRQLAGILEPLVVPLDIGEGADTIEIVNRLIALRRCTSLRLTHLMGSDTLPVAARLLPEDLAAWGKAATSHGVDLDFSIFVVRRDRRQVLEPFARAVRAVPACPWSSTGPSSARLEHGLSIRTGSHPRPADGGRHRQPRAPLPLRDEQALELPVEPLGQHFYE
ncbi:MAG: hypothetical protein MZW92_17015 [Comamonadaceae bacterium]|nr:hypothetical protein [Comamonadaceae bacterium]